MVSWAAQAQAPQPQGPPSALLLQTRLVLQNYVKQPLRRIAELMTGTSLSDAPLWVLGRHFPEAGSPEGDGKLSAEELKSFQQDFRARIWCSYRHGFPALGGTGICSDVGWGCTIRSGQMMMAEAVARLLLGRSWRQPAALSADTKLMQLLMLVHDSEGSPLSIHNICTAGREYGIVPGRWLGPWVLCKALEVAVNKAQPASLRVHVVCDPGGGAPTMECAEVEALFGSSSSGDPAAEAAEAAAKGSEQPPEEEEQRRSSSPASTPAGAPEEQSEEACTQKAVETPSGLVEAGGPSSAAEKQDHGAQHGALGASEPPDGCPAADAVAAAATVSVGPPAGTAAGEGGGEWTHIPACSSSGESATGSGEHIKASLASSSDHARVQRLDSLDSSLPSNMGHGTCGAEGVVVAASQPESVAGVCSVTPPEHVAVLGSSGALSGPDEGLGASDRRSTPQQPGSGTGSSCGEPSTSGSGWQDHTSGSRSAAAGLGGEGSKQQPCAPVLLLVPLTLGVEKMNPLYYPQLQHVLSYPQSVGIVGGRPGASLFFIGCQAGSLIYLDPHESKAVARLPADTASYFCDTPRLMPITGIDPSLAIGFLCTSREEFVELKGRLVKLAEEHRAAPLLLVSTSNSGARTLGHLPSCGLPDDMAEEAAAAAGGPRGRSRDADAAAQVDSDGWEVV